MTENQIYKYKKEILEEIKQGESKTSKRKIKNETNHSSSENKENNELKSERQKNKKKFMILITIIVFS